jgi:hypothetical protein
MHRFWVEGFFNAERAQVGDRMLPQRYEFVMEPEEDEERPGLRLVFEVLDGVPRCRELHLISSDHGREVRRTDLRLPIEDYLEYATTYVAQPVKSTRLEPDMTAVMELDQSGLDSFRRVVQSSRRQVSRRGPGETELREAAELYAATKHAPTEAVAARFGIAHRTASLWISRAKKLGYL